jgi:hypothetical protein
VQEGQEKREKTEERLQCFAVAPRRFNPYGGNRGGVLSRFFRSRLFSLHETRPVSKAALYNKSIFPIGGIVKAEHESFNRFSQAQRATWALQCKKATRLWLRRLAREGALKWRLT